MYIADSITTNTIPRRYGKIIFKKETLWNENIT